MQGIGTGWRSWVVAALTASLWAGGAQAAPTQCVGDCNADNQVLIHELLLMVNVALGTQSVSVCEAGDPNDDGEIMVDEIVVAIGAGLDGCQATTPTSVPTPSPTLAPCTSAQQTACLVCGQLRGCCPAPNPAVPSCFDPSVECSFPCPDPIPTNWIGSTECGPGGSAVACLVNPTTTPVNTSTPLPTGTATLTATAQLTPTPTLTTPPTASPTLAPCTSQQSACSLCSGFGGCCPAPNPSTPSCFDPSVTCTFPCPDPIPANWIGSTECGPGGSAVACLIGPTPSPGGPTATPTEAPTGTPTGTPSGAPTDIPTDTPTLAAPTPTDTPSMPATATPTTASTDTPTGAASATPTDTPSGDPTPTPTPPTMSSCPAGYRAFNFYNNCGEDIWPAAQNLVTSTGNLNGWHMPEPPAQCSQNGDCANGETCIGGRCAFTACVPNGNQSATFWARTDCQFEAGGGCPSKTPNCCDSGNCVVNGSGNVDCAGVGANNSDPTTLGEISLSTPSFNVDTYDVSVIDGFNLAIQIVPLGTFADTPSGNAGVYWCQSPGCPAEGCLGPQLGACTWSDFISTCPAARQFTGYISGNVVGCSTGHNLCSTGWPNPSTTAFECTAALPNAAISCSTNDDCPVLTGLVVAQPTPGSCAGVTCPGNSVCTTSNKYLNTDAVVCELSCQGGTCTAPSCTTDADCDDGAGSPLAGTFMVCDTGSGTCVPSTTSLFLNTGINGQSCYVDFASTACSGCPTDASDPLHTDWPTTATSACINDNASWSANVGPSLAAFKKICPTAYAYPFDDKTSTFNCQGAGDWADNLDYEITFCPSGG